MTQGYIIIGTDDYGKTQNITCAYVLCLSLKLADPTREVCVVVNKFADVPKKYEDVFDYIVELPFGRTDSNHDNIFIDFWQLYYCTPFDETIFINTYAYAINNVESLWEVAAFGDLGVFIPTDFASDFFELRALQNNDKIEFDGHFADLFYFKKSEAAAEFFKMADPVFKNWRYVYQTYAENVKSKNFDLNVTVNIVLLMIGKTITANKLFDYSNLMLRNDEHQKIDDIEWLQNLNLWFDIDLATFKINNFNQRGVLVYNDPRIVEKFDLRKLHDNYRKTNTKVT